MTPRHLSVVFSADSSRLVAGLDQAVARLQQRKREQVRHSYRALRDVTDPRGHDLLGAIEAHHLGVVDALFEGMTKGRE